MNPPFPPCAVKPGTNLIGGVSSPQECRLAGPFSKPLDEWGSREIAELLQGEQHYRQFSDFARTV